MSDWCAAEPRYGPSVQYRALPLQLVCVNQTTLEPHMNEITISWQSLSTYIRISNQFTMQPLLLKNLFIVFFGYSIHSATLSASSVSFDMDILWIIARRSYKIDNLLIQPSSLHFVAISFELLNLSVLEPREYLLDLRKLFVGCLIRPRLLEPAELRLRKRRISSHQKVAELEFTRMSWIAMISPLKYKDEKNLVAVVIFAASSVLVAT